MKENEWGRQRDKLDQPFRAQKNEGKFTV